ncbi:MAG: PP2C family protein-serine/threonine phosphatase [Phycisphaerales bacterium]
MTAPATISGSTVRAEPPDAPRPLSITGFLTDGSLPAMCDELTRLTGVGVALLDHAGHRVTRAAGPVPWSVAEHPEHAHPAPGLFSVPIEADGTAIGSLRVEPGTPRLGGDAPRASLEGTVRLLAETAGGFCRQDLELRHRVKEIKALARLSSLLARATDVRAVLDIALESALDVLALDAGSIVLFDKDEGVRAENEDDLVLLASRNLSREWLDCPSPASKGRLFDRLALKGEIVVSEDLRADDRVLIPDLVRSEGLRGFINCGLLFQDKPIGVIRLYARTPRTFGEADRRLLRSIAHQAAVAVEQARLLKVREQDDRMQRQLQLARDVQRRMLPRRIPVVPRLDVGAKYEPSFALGGDFYDLFELAENLGIAIGDVVGKGIAAALLMSAVRASLRAHVQDLYHLDDAIQRVNVAMTRDLLDNEFATLWYGVVEPAKLRLTYCSAGHEPPFIVRIPPDRPPGPAEVDELSIGGMAVGIDPTQRYQRGTYDLHPRDVLVAYTDGITDALDFSGRRYGKPRLRQAVLALLASEPEASSARVIEHVFWELRQHTGVLQRPDDQTIVVLRVKD